MSTATEGQRTNRRKQIGLVSSRSGDKSVKVTVAYKTPHPLYHKVVNRQTVLHVHDEKNETKVGDLLDQMPGLERRKLDLLESEQRDLAKFLSPTQRARYFGLQDELRRGMQDLQRRRMGMDDSTNAPTESRGDRRRGNPPLM